MNLTQLVLASHNAGKLKELQAMLGASVQLRSIGEFSSIEPEETGLSFVENAILKARNAARISGLPALADDSGLAVDFLGGAPGIYSARYADGQGDAANNAKLLEALRTCPGPARCAVRLRPGPGAPRRRPAADPLRRPLARSHPHRCQWRTRLRLRPAVLGTGAQLLQRRTEPGGKNQLSHRARAMAILRQRLGLQ